MANDKYARSPMTFGHPTFMLLMHLVELGTISYQELEMKRQVFLGVISLVLAAILLLLGLTKIYFPGNPNVTIYPAGFFALCGIFLLLHVWWTSYKSDQSDEDVLGQS